MDHMIGKFVVPILTGKSSGRPIARAIHSPKIAPTNPSAIETRQPPREKPVIACPSAPQIPATIRRMRRSNNVMRRIITALSCCAPVVTFMLLLTAVASATVLAQQKSELVGSYLVRHEWGGTRITLKNNGTFTAESGDCTGVTTRYGPYSLSNNVVRFKTVKLTRRSNDSKKEIDLTKRKARKEILETD